MQSGVPSDGPNSGKGGADYHLETRGPPQYTPRAFAPRWSARLSYLRVWQRSEHSERPDIRISLDPVQIFTKADVHLVLRIMVIPFLFVALAAAAMVFVELVGKTPSEIPSRARNLRCLHWVFNRSCLEEWDRLPAHRLVRGLPRRLIV